MEEGIEVRMDELTENKSPFSLEVREVDMSTFNSTLQQHQDKILVEQDKPFVESSDPNKILINDSALHCLVFYVHANLGGESLFLSGHFSNIYGSGMLPLDEIKGMSEADIVTILKWKEPYRRYDEFIYRMRHLMKEYGKDNIEIYLFGQNVKNPLSTETKRRKQQVSANLENMQKPISDMLSIGVPPKRIKDCRRVFSQKRDHTMLIPSEKVIYNARE